MRKPTRPREVGRGERVLPGVWRLRLPLPWPGVPHCNAWAIAAGDGIVLVDTGTHEPGSLGTARARARPGRPAPRARAAARLHARPRRPLRPGRADRRARGLRAVGPSQPRPLQREADDPEAAHARRVEIARQSGVPVEPPDRGRPLAAGPAASPTATSCPASRSRRDLGAWSVHETPGHAPSHVCLFQPERRLLISGDHLLGRVSLYFDYGWSPDPVGEFLGLARHDRRSQRPARAERPRPPVLRRPRAPRRPTGGSSASASTRSWPRSRTGPSTAYDLLPAVYGDKLTPAIAALDADQGALLPDPPRGHRRRAAHRGGAGALGD